MKFHGRIKFTYIETDKVKKTIGSTILTYESFPQELRQFIIQVFPDFYSKRGIHIVVDTVCREGDSYNRETGKDIVRYKIEKRYYTIVRMLVRAASEYYSGKIKNIYDLRISSENRKKEAIKKLSSF